MKEHECEFHWANIKITLIYLLLLLALVSRPVENANTVVEDYTVKGLTSIWR